MKRNKINYVEYGKKCCALITFQQKPEINSETNFRNSSNNQTNLVIHDS